MTIDEAMHIYGEARQDLLSGAVIVRHANAPNLFRALTVLAERFYTTSKSIERICNADKASTEESC